MLESSLMMISSLVLCDILVRIWEVISLQYDRWRILFWSSSDHGLLCKSFFIFFSEKSAPFVYVMSMLFIYLFISCLTHLSFCYCFWYFIDFFDHISRGNIFYEYLLVLEDFLGGLMIEVYFVSEKVRWMGCGSIEWCLRPGIVLYGQMS